MTREAQPFSVDIIPNLGRACRAVPERLRTRRR
jgi:hypothetical protein